MGMGLVEHFPLRDSEGNLWRQEAKTNRRRLSERPSEGSLADRLAERHSREIRFLAAADRDRMRRQPARRAAWIAWNGEEWLPNDAAAQRLAREICREAAEECDEPAIDSARVVSAVLSLAKCDLRLACADWPCDPQVEVAVDGWIADHCALDPNAWTRRSDLLTSFVGWEQFDPNEVASAWAARRITYRRKGNSPGFDGVRLRGDEDVDA
jgi:hypothetical protein